jgi:hypothetical protein
VLAASSAPLHLFSRVAVQHALSGGLSAADWIGILIGGGVVALVLMRITHSPSVTHEDDPRGAALTQRINDLTNDDCRWLCHWLAQDSTMTQQALENALGARESAIQDSDGNE